MCPSCFEAAEREARENSPEAKAADAAHLAFLAQLEERRREEARRAPNAEFLCALHRDHGRATFLVEGLMLCRRCAESFHAKFDRGGEHPLTRDVPALALERQVAELAAKVAALETALAAKRKGGGQ